MTFSGNPWQPLSGQKARSRFHPVHPDAQDRPLASSTPTSEYAGYPATARNGSFPEHPLPRPSPTDDYSGYPTIARSGSFPEHHLSHAPPAVGDYSGYPTTARSGSFPTHLQTQDGPFAYPASTSEYMYAAYPASLTVLDNRTHRVYNLPIEHNSIRATEFQKIKTPRNGQDPVEQNNAGIRIFDPGFQNTACTKSQITYVDGDAGEMAYRGIRVAKLFNSGRPFEHIAFLLIFRHLPSELEVARFNRSIATSEMPPQAIFDTINNLPPETHASTAIGAILALYVSLCPQKIPAYRGENLYKGNIVAVDNEVPQQILTVSVIVSAIFCRLHGREFAPPQPSYSYTENILHMMRLVEPGTGKPDPRVVQLLSRMMILMADHETTNSASVLLSTASTLADPYSCCAAATLSGIGILHGGAIEVAHKQFEAVRDLKEVPVLIEAVKSGRTRLFGYSQRKGKLPDPRSILFRELITKAMQDTESLKDDHHLAVALEIDRIASQDPYFQSRNLCADADVLLSLVYKALGIPTEFILPMTLLNRNPGYMAHWREAMADPKHRMWRPLQIYVGKIPPEEQEDDLKKLPMASSSL